MSSKRVLLGIRNWFLFASRDVQGSDFGGSLKQSCSDFRGREGRDRAGHRHHIDRDILALSIGWKPNRFPHVADRFIGTIEKVGQRSIRQPIDTVGGPDKFSNEI